MIQPLVYCLLLSSCQLEPKQVHIDKTIEIKSENITDYQDTVISNKSYSTDYFFEELSKSKIILAKQKELKGNPLKFTLRDTTLKNKQIEYWIQAGYDNGIRMVNVYNFICEANTGEIFLLDTYNDKKKLIKK